MVGIICPVEAELKPYLACLANAKSRLKAMVVFYEGIIFGQKAVIVSCGVGKVNAAACAQSMIDSYSPDHIIVSGTAGGIDKSLKIGDTVISEDAVYHDLKESMLTDFPPRLREAHMKADPGLIGGFKAALKLSGLPQRIVYGRMATGDAFVERKGRAAIVKSFDPLCVDMETAAIAHVATLNGVPFIAVRSVSDTEEQGGLAAFRENCALAALNSYKTVECYLKYKEDSGKAFDFVLR